MTLVAGVDSSTQSVKIVAILKPARSCAAGEPHILPAPRCRRPRGWRPIRRPRPTPVLLDGVFALAVGGQQHGMVTLDEEGELVRDALLWNDNRSAPMPKT